MMKLYALIAVLLINVCGQSDAGLVRRSRVGQILDIMLPRLLLEDFQYVPTREGYRYSYKLADGTVREEIGIITNPDTDQQAMLVMGVHSRNNGNSMTMTMGRFSRPRGMSKNRKLSPKALQSLTG